MCDAPLAGLSKAGVCLAFIVNYYLFDIPILQDMPYKSEPVERSDDADADAVAAQLLAISESAVASEPLLTPWEVLHSIIEFFVSGFLKD